MDNEPRNIGEAVEKAKSKHATPTVSGLLRDGSLIEMVHRPEEHRTLLCVAKEGEISYVTNILEDGQRLAPYSPENNLLKNDVVLFPSEAAEYESDHALIEEIRQFIHRYVDISPLFEQIASYYT